MRTIFAAGLITLFVCHAYAEDKLPFVGDRMFNFAGSAGTASKITIHSDGLTDVYDCGFDSTGLVENIKCDMPEYHGAFHNPIKFTRNDHLYTFTATTAYMVDKKGNILKNIGCNGDPSDNKENFCMVDLQPLEKPSDSPANAPATNQ